jgi:HK97 family phage major capsid protein
MTFTATDRQTYERLIMVPAEKRTEADKAQMGRLWLAKNGKASPAAAPSINLREPTDADIAEVKRRAAELRIGPPTAREGYGRGSAEYRAAIDSYLRRGLADITVAEARTLRTHSETRDMGTTTGAQGGFLAPQDFWPQVALSLKSAGGLIALASQIVTDDGAPMPFPTNSDVANNSGIIADDAAPGATDLVFGSRTLFSYNYVANNLLALSWQLVADATVDILGLLATALGNRIHRALGNHFVNGLGSGSSQPLGLLGQVTNVTTLPTGNTTTLTYNALVDLVYSLDAAYRDRASFLANDTTLRLIAKLTDASTRPILVPAREPGQPAMLLGYPVYTDNNLPVPSANAKTVLFGDFERAYVWRMVQGPQLAVLKETRADKLQNLYLAYLRSDGAPRDLAAAAVLAQSAT